MLPDRRSMVKVSGMKGSYTFPQVMYLLSLCTNETGTKTLKRGLH